MGDYIAKAPIRRVMRSVGAYLVADEALALLIETLEKFGGDVTKKAQQIAEGDKRKRITAVDIAGASKNL